MTINKSGIMPVAPLVISVILLIFGCATDESQFDNSFTNDAFQKIMGEDGVTEDHLTDGADMDPATHPSAQGHNPPQRRVAPRQPQQRHLPNAGDVGGGWIGDSIPMDPNH